MGSNVLNETYFHAKIRVTTIQVLMEIHEMSDLGNPASTELP